MTILTPTRTRPFRGLDPFGVEDERYFFGRSAESDAIFTRLFACRLTIVYGSPGVGKSSVLRAGVVPRIRDHDLAFPVLITRWSESPLNTINAALDVIANSLPGETLEDRLRRTV